MIQLKKILQERISDTVYHITSIYKLYSILKENQFILNSTVERSEYHYSRNRFYYLSTSRSKNNWYFKDYTSDNLKACILVLDGNKLNNKYKGIPVDYFSTAINRITWDEMEDRIISNNPEISNAKSYIKEIHIYYLAEQYSTEDNNNIYTLLNKIKKMIKSIPIYFYTDRNSFLKLNKKDTIDIPEININTKEYEITKVEYDETPLVKSIFNLYYNVNKSDYSFNKIQSKYNLIKINYFIEDIISSIKIGEFKIKIKKYNRINDFIDRLTNAEKNSFFKLLRKNKITLSEFADKVIYNISQAYNLTYSE